MSEDPISGREFDLYVKMNAESTAAIKEAVIAIQEQGQKTLNILQDHTTSNDKKHDETNKRITNLIGEIQDIKKDNILIKEAVEANSKITSFAMMIKKGFAILISGILLAVGGIYANKWWGQ